ncbi:MAG: NUDIX domain-containing protein [Sedimentibacter saalensis]|uniref:NUDIX domain-containing protein n=1 Tax=Sedimentibacter saalensis TaxID=130788 RepID=UPI002B212AB0|nr:NUDIX domain-containing protein [Sedimentibacter saalensis]MEA5095032.1 NUDIX domain-containing protein [Sedimentibacter saalensis]
MENIFNVDEITFGEKLENTDYFQRKAVYGIVINSEGKIATIETPGGYFLPGGGIENNESHEMCLKREFLEETGYEITVGNYIGRSSMYHIAKKYKYMHGIVFFYFADLYFRKNNGTEKDHKLIWLEPSECINGLFFKHQSWATAKAMNIKGLTIKL